MNLAHNDHSAQHNDVITLTRRHLDALKTSTGCLTKATVEALGFSFTKVRKGWLSALEGTQIPASVYSKALEGKSVFTEGTKRRFEKRKSRATQQPSLPAHTLIGPRGSQPLTPADIISGLLMELDCLLANRPAEPHVRQHIEQLRRNSEAYLGECGYRKVGETWLPISTLTNSKED